MKTSRKDGLATKTRILDAAERLFAQKGVVGTSLVDVSIEAGQKNRNAAQYHFGDRTGLICAVLDRHEAEISVQRMIHLEQIDQSPQVTVRDLVNAQVLPVVNHAQNHPNGRSYLLLNRQLTNSGEHTALSLERVNELSDVRRLHEKLVRVMPAQNQQTVSAKMILVRCMLINGMADFYDLEPDADGGQFVATLCASIEAVILAR